MQVFHKILGEILELANLEKLEWIDIKAMHVYVAQTLLQVFNNSNPSGILSVKGIMILIYSHISCNLSCKL